MTLDELVRAQAAAVTKARVRKIRSGRAFLVTRRDAHPRIKGPVFLVIAKADKRLWAPDETRIFDTDYEALRFEGDA